MVLAPLSARRRAMAVGGWTRKVRLSDCSLFGPWAVLWTDPKHVLLGFWVLTWAFAAQFIVLVLAAVTSPAAMFDALPPPLPSPRVRSGEDHP